MRKMKGGDLYNVKRKPKSSPQNASEPRKRKSGTRIPKESKKRQEEHIYYTQHCKELTQEIKDANGGKIYCFFTGKEITGVVQYHHLRGRTGNFYVDKDYLVPCLNEPHLKFHSMTVEQLQREPWYSGFMSRLEKKDKTTWQKQLDKAQKTILFEDE